jgi:hypothetical protein
VGSARSGRECRKIPGGPVKLAALFMRARAVGPRGAESCSGEERLLHVSYFADLLNDTATIPRPPTTHVRHYSTAWMYNFGRVLTGHHMMASAPVQSVRGRDEVL